MIRPALALGIAFLALAAASAQVPPDIGGGLGRKTPERPNTANPSWDARKLREQASQLRLRAGDLNGKAEELRDRNKDDLAEPLEERADRLSERASKLEDKARQIELSGGSQPGRVFIPDL